MTLTSNFSISSASQEKSVNDEHEHERCFIHSKYDHITTSVRFDQLNQQYPVVTTSTHTFQFRTKKKVPRLGLLLVGLGGNNGSTVTASILANKNNISWNTKFGTIHPNYFGSLLMSSTTRLGVNQDTGEDVFAPLHGVLPMVDPSDIEIGGWDINNFDLSHAMKRSCVFDYDLQSKLREDMSKITPMPSVYYPDFIASNQKTRANNVIPGFDKGAHLAKLRTDIKTFKESRDIEEVVVIWTANTERNCVVTPGVHDTAKNLLDSIETSHSEISASTLFAVASILENVPFINGSPQNTLVPGCVELARNMGVFVGGDDFKSGQTKFKSVMVDFLVNSGIKPRSIVSYNHLGNNDGKNLSAPHQFRSKEISKSNVVDDMVASNEILYPPVITSMNGHSDSGKDKIPASERPDHTVVIKYVPAVGDSKRALDEYESDIFMNGRNTFVVHNTCEDSLLAAPLILDLAIMCELCQRIEYRIEGESDGFKKFDVVLSLLSYWLKAPKVPDNSPVVNSLFKQRACIENLLRVCAGLPPETNLGLEHRTSLLQNRKSDSSQ